MKATETIIPPEILQEIFDSPIPWTDDKEEGTAKDLVLTLSPEDLETAAQGSYAYWVASISDKPPTEEQRMHFAIREARRHIFRVKYEDAVVNLKKTCEYRRERRIDLFRACFTPGIEFDNEADEQEAEKLRTQITADLKRQPAYVRGTDKWGRALLLSRSRTEKDTVDEEFVASQIYLMERAIASTEFVSKGVQEKIVVVLDFGSFKSATSPPMSAVKAIASVLQTKYSERLKNMVIIDPPLWMRTAYSIIKPFLDPTTKAKFLIATGDKKKLEAVSGLVEPSQAMPWMLPSGKLETDVDLERFMKTVPFHCLYDYES